MAKSRRRANFELLRLLAMFMVMVLHYLSCTGALPAAGEELGRGAAAAVLAESLCIVAVNVYVLMSGYFLSGTAFAWRRVFAVIAQTLFYTLLIPPVLAVLGALPAGLLADPYHLWNSLFPVQSGHYWFVTAYVILCLFSPFLNAAAERLEKKRFAQLLGGLLLFFCLGKTLSPIQFATDRYGYDYGWFFCLYLIGAWLRRYGLSFLNSAKRGLALYLGSAGLTAAMELALLSLAGRVRALLYYASVPFHYNFLLCLTGALGLFALFYHLEIRSKRAAALIGFFAPAVLGVYLIHEQADVAQNWCLWTQELTGIRGPWLVIPAFLACLLIDKLRSLLFAAAARFFDRLRPALQRGGRAPGEKGGGYDEKIR